MALQADISKRIQLALSNQIDTPAWKIKPALVMQINNIQGVVPRVFKGTPLPAEVPVVAVPRPLINPDAGRFGNFNLGSPAVELRGSFAPTVTDAGFTYIAGTDNVTIYYDGTHGSQRIKQRRRTGYNETLPPGFITIQGLTPSAVGAAVGPTYELIPFYIPGSCAVGWVAGNAGTPQFAFTAGTVTPEDLNQASIRGREAIAATVVSVTLQPVPVPPPPPAVPPPPDPGSQSGNTTTNGTLTTIVDYPGQNAAENLTFNGSAHASDSSGKNITGWEVYLDNVKIYNVTTGPTPNITFPINTNPGSHSLDVKAYNSTGSHADVIVPFTTSDLSGGTSGGGGNPTPPPPTNPTPTPIPNCVMLGTVLEMLGPSPWHQQQLPQNEWVRIFSERGRELIGTPDHPVYTARAGRTELRDVREGDKCVCIDGEETIADVQHFVRPGFKIKVHMDWGHLFWANGYLSHNIKLNLT